MQHAEYAIACVKDLVHSRSELTLEHLAYSDDEDITTLLQQLY